MMGAGLQELERRYVMSHQIRALTNIEILLRSYCEDDDEGGLAALWAL